MSALRSAGFPVCGFWGHSCPHFQELRPHPLLITPNSSRVGPAPLTSLVGSCSLAPTLAHANHSKFYAHEPNSLLHNHGCRSALVAHLRQRADVDQTDEFGCSRPIPLCLLWHE